MCVACLVSFFTQRRKGAKKNSSHGDAATQHDKNLPLLKDHHPLVGHDQRF